MLITQLREEIFPVGRSAHSSAEDGFDDEGVERFERLAVGVTEGGGEFFAWVGDVVAEGLGCEI